jgi:hypothetical protein
MSGFGTGNIDGGDQFSQVVLTGSAGSALTRILLAENMVPGDQPSYELAKLLFGFHPLGAKMAEAPVNMAQSQEREITVPVSGEEEIVAAYKTTWKKLGAGAGADALIKSLKTQSRIYGICALAMGDRNRPETTNQPVDWESLSDAKPYFNILDPLNTAGSLILDQNPNSPDFQKPVAARVGGKIYHPSRTLITINEMPLYIQWSDSAFGFSGRSVYQRALYPMRTFLQSLITDWLVTVKCGLLIHKAKAPGPVQNNRVLRMFGFKRSSIQGGVTGQVLTIGEGEDIVSLNFQNLEGPAKFARDNALKNTAMAASMPAKMLEQEELVGGFGEGTEDSKQIARYVDRLRIEMNPEYAFFDRITQHIAWSPAFYNIMQRAHPDAYRGVPYRTAFQAWQNAFVATWPNLLEEPESEKIQVEKVRFESVVAIIETMAPILKAPGSRATLVSWAADEISSRRKLFSNPLVIDEEEEAEAQKEAQTMGGMPGEDIEDEKEPTAPPFSGRT